MILVFLGPPGAGKGTQAKLLSQDLKLKHISTGDLLRESVRERTPLGLKAKGYMDRGELVPDDLIIAMIEEVMPEDGGAILDGFPRTIKQAQALQDMLNKHGKHLCKVFFFDLDDNTIVNRLSGRRVCPNCGTLYHTDFKPPKKDEVCDLCGTRLIQREDDKEEVVRKRLDVYRRQTAEVIDFYNKGNKLIHLDAGQDIKKVYQELRKALKDGC
ncbi:MAG: adenylate kinase [Aquificaceae bacterium]